MNTSSLESELTLVSQESPKKQRKRIQSAPASNNLVFSSYSTDNSQVFPHILDLYVEDGATIADVTYGKGVFWRCVDTSKYNFFPSDLKTGVDARNLPYDNDSFDACVLDPPYMEGLYRKDTSMLAGSGSHFAFRESYSNGQATSDPNLKYHDKVLDLYLSIGKEIHRVLRHKGIFIVKCQDEVSANRQKLTHVELLYAYEKMGFYCEDLFVVTRTNRPGVSSIKKQVHARKNHSYFLVLRLLKDKKKLPYSNFGELLTHERYRVNLQDDQLL